MAFKERTEIVGKQFVCVESESLIHKSDIKEREWRSGVVRAASDRDILTETESQVRCYDHLLITIFELNFRLGLGIG